MRTWRLTIHAGGAERPLTIHADDHRVDEQGGHVFREADGSLVAWVPGAIVIAIAEDLPPLNPNPKTPDL